VRAYETQLEFSGKAGHAVVVECEKPWRFVFWDKAQYVGCLDLGDGVWFTSEWCETNSPNDLHCYEPIMDKQLRWSKVQILESGPARARVRWTYALCDMRYRIFHGNTRAEETYTIYPDGVAVREVVLWPGTQNNHGGNANLWQVAEWILITAAGTSPLDVLQMPAPFTLWSGSGESIQVPWPLPALDFQPFCAHYPQVANWPMYVGRINLQGTPNPFIVICKNQALFPYVPCCHCKGDHPYFNLFPGKDLHNIYKHWPVTDIEDFIQWVPAGDDVGKVATHTSFVDVNFALRRSAADYIPTPDQGATWYLLVGAAGQSTPGSELEELAHSYHSPARIEVQRDPGEPEELHRGRVLLEGYDHALRAHVLRKQGEDRVRLTMHPTSPQINPVFLINGWNSPYVTVIVDEAELRSDDFRAQVCGHDLVIWIHGRFAETTQFSFLGSRESARSPGS
jgi:hypothetical protein